MIGPILSGRCYAFSVMRRASFLLLLLLSGLPAFLAAAPFPCKPCAGVRLEPAAMPAPDIPEATAALLLQIGHLEAGSPLYLAWETVLGQTDTAAATGHALQAVRAAGGTPWISLVFRTPAPLAQGSERLQSELRAAAALATQAPAGAWFQVVWQPDGQENASFAPAEYAFLLKRAAVTLTGAKPDARVATEALPPDVKALETFYGEEVAAYLEAVALQPPRSPPRSRPCSGSTPAAPWSSTACLCPSRRPRRSPRRPAPSPMGSTSPSSAPRPCGLTRWRLL